LWLVLIVEEHAANLAINDPHIRGLPDDPSPSWQGYSISV
jgi:hypothetical protein